MTRNIVSAGALICFAAAAAIYFASLPTDRRRLPDASIAAAQQVLDPPFVMFRTLAPKEMHGRVALVSAANPGGTRHVSNLSCARVHYAGGTGLCLIEDAQGSTVLHAAYTFDRAFTPGRRIELPGIPTRVRVSPSGRMAAITVYAEEHAPNGDERLATNSIIVELASGAVILNLRDVSIDSSDLPSLDGPLDFGSVSFERDADRFFATLSTVTEHYLIAGSIAARRVRIVGAGMASEALSPDGTQLIVKKRVGQRGHWQLAVLDLATNIAHALNQGVLSVDDQVEWLDARHVMYHDAAAQGTGVWALATDGIAGPRLLVPDAYSPSGQQ